MGVPSTVSAPSSAPESPLQTVAGLVLRRSLGLKRGDSVIIEAWTHMLPWARALSTEARRNGIRPMVLYEDEEAYWQSVESAQSKDVGTVGAAEWAALQATDGYVFLRGPEDARRFDALPPEKRSALVGYNSEWYRRAEKAKIRGCRIEMGRATRTLAERYGVDLAGWQSELLRACQVDPRTFAREAQRLVPRLRKGRRLTIKHANGTSLELALAGRAPFADDGVVDEADVRAGNNLCTIPGAAVLTSVDERIAEGRFVANRPTFLRGGRMEGGVWTFEKGKLTEARYRVGEEHFRTPYDQAPAGKEKPGFVSFGLNPELRFAPGLEDQERGVMTLGIGGNSSYGGKNRVGYAAWLVLHGAHVELDGRTILADGELL